MCAGASERGGKRAEALRNCLQVLPQDSLLWEGHFLQKHQYVGSSLHLQRRMET